MEKIIFDVQNEMNCLKDEKLNKLADEIVDIIYNKGQENKIYVYGAGRSGFIGRSFVMRLVQLGLRSYFIGESSTPFMHKDDIIILISGSGQTKPIPYILEVIKKIGLYCIMITVNKKTKVPHINLKVPIGGKSKTNTKNRKMPLGSYFEINSLIFLESIIAKIIDKYPELKKNIIEFGKRYENDEIIVF